MNLKALSHDVRSMLCASAQINNYKTAVVELVYNSLDAESTCIAIRVNIQENSLQVIDNGCGIIKNDFERLGKRYMTSKVTNIKTLKLMPKYYGFRGEFLTNLIEIAQCVKIISRYKDGEETWAQKFDKHKKNHLIKMTTRPSKGTTVDVKGFLYNLKIKKQAIDPLNDLQNIKIFLEQLSIVHNDISLSLRDDSKNEIIFKIHKKRNIYQTLSTLFDINPTDVQELQIEKKKIKVKGYIGITHKIIEKHWIYLNGRLLQNISRLHKITNEYLRKYLHLTDIKSKYRRNCGEDLFKSNIPFYFIFITCPYNDYDISYTLRQSHVEFKNWEQMQIMLEKLIKFYVGDTQLKEIKRSEPEVIIQNKNYEHHRDNQCQIKKIVNKILGSNSKKIMVSQLHNGIKGRLVKRKNRNKNKEIDHCNQSLSKPNQLPIQYDEVNVSNIILSEIYSKNKESFAKGKNSISNKRDRKIMSTDKRIQGHLKKDTIVMNDSMNKNTVKPSKIKKMKRKHQNETDCMPVAKLVKKPIQDSIYKQKVSKMSTAKNNNQQEVFEFLEETHTIPKRSKIIAQKAKECLNNHCNYSTIEVAESSEFSRRKHCFNYTMCEAKPVLIPKLNKRTNNNYVEHKFKRNAFKTTYDLVQTILESVNDQDKVRYDQRDINLEISVKNPTNRNHTLLNHIFSEYCNSYKQQELTYNNIPNKLKASEITYNSTYNKSIDRQYRIKDTHKYNKTPVELTSHNLKCEDVFKEINSLEHFTQNYRSSYLPEIQTVSALTYQSHNYDKYLKMYDENTQTYIFKNQNKHCSIRKTKTTRFITNKSKENFIHRSNKYVPKNCVKNKYHGSVAKQFYNRQVNQMMDKSYTIEFTTSNEIDFLFNKEKVSMRSQHNMENKHFILNSYLPCYEPTIGFGNTYTILTYNTSSDHKITQHESKSVIPNEVFLTNSVHCSNTGINNNIAAMDIDNIKNKTEHDNHEIPLVSKLKSIDYEVNMDEEIQPMNFCETVFHENETIEKEFAFSFNIKSKSNDSLYNHSNKSNSNNEDKSKYPAQTITSTLQNIHENMSDHFINSLNTNNVNDKIRQSPVAMIRNEEEVNNLNGQESQNLNRYNTDYYEDGDHAASSIKDNKFNFKERLRFLPKGMSQIFEKSASRAICDYNVDEDYFEDVIYNDFANDIEKQTEVYEPEVQNVEDLATKDIQKFKMKVDKENTSLVFDETSLKDARILNQVDSKFVAACMKGRSRGSGTASDYLILFDQHAVHERIRLEKNLEEYFTEDQWRSVPLDNITLKMSKHEILYLHNYKDKFNQLGLQWSIVDKNEVSISSIPKAILGKNPREVEKVMKAVKDLIKEEINEIKLQKGCISLYPKSIMNLVFSESCRYAIKFGDKLSKRECFDLLHDLSNCKTPFQCAHGRPVMAVLLDIRNARYDYNLNIESLKLFKLKRMMHVK